jgi:hypothetical protein
VFLCTSHGLAQQTTTSSETKKFEIIAVTGNDLVVRLPEGTRELTVPDDFMFTVDGQPLSVSQLKPGMMGTATITTKTTMTPVTATEIKEGTVLQVAGSTIMVRTKDGVRSFTQGEVDKRGVKIIRSGKPAQLSDFRAGDKLSATIVTSQPPNVVTEKEVQAILASAPPPAPPAPAPPAPAPPKPQPVAPARAAVVDKPAAAPTTGTVATLPRTAGPLPWMVLLGLTSVGIGVLRAWRRRSRS